MKTYFIFICIMITIGVCIYFAANFFSKTDTIELSDIINYPESYVEQIFTNRVIMIDWNCFANKKDGQSFTLEMSYDLENQVKTLFKIYKKNKEVKITYWLYNWDIFVQLEECRQDTQKILPKIAFELDSETIFVEDINSIGILLHIEVPQYH